jgi:hypothetical protein
VTLYRWPYQSDFPVHVRLRPTDIEHKCLLAAGYVEDTSTEKNVQFTAKALALVAKEEPLLRHTEFGRVEYETTQLINRPTFTAPPTKPSYGRGPMQPPAWGTIPQQYPAHSSIHGSASAPGFPPMPSPQWGPAQQPWYGAQNVAMPSFNPPPSRPPYAGAFVEPTQGYGPPPYPTPQPYPGPGAYPPQYPSQHRRPH